MRFYYISVFSVVLLGLIYVVGTAVLAWLWYSLRKWKRAWMLMVPLFALLYISPVAEELWIAWNFEQLCKKDAGIFVYKTVEVEGFYDATRSTHDGPPTDQSIVEFEQSGYRFYERRFGDTGKVVHIEKTNGVWVPTVLDHPSARYHYKWPHMNTPWMHKVTKIERVVIDSETGEILGRYLDYTREAPWFFIGLDRPLMFCKEAENDARKRGTGFSPNMVLLPTQLGSAGKRTQ